MSVAELALIGEEYWLRLSTVNDYQLPPFTLNSHEVVPSQHPSVPYTTRVCVPSPTETTVLSVVSLPPAQILAVVETCSTPSTVTDPPFPKSVGKWNSN
jgi:hypothetical protein